MAKTSLTLPAPLHQRLVLAARYQQQAFSELVRDLLDKALATEEQGRTNEVYKDLAELQGIGPKGLPDVSTTVNDIYGDNGAWKPAEE